MLRSAKRQLDLQKREGGRLSNGHGGGGLEADSKHGQQIDLSVDRHWKLELPKPDKVALPQVAEYRPNMVDDETLAGIIVPRSVGQPRRKRHGGHPEAHIGAVLTGAGAFSAVGGKSANKLAACRSTDCPSCVDTIRSYSEAFNQLIHDLEAGEIERNHFERLLSGRCVADAEHTAQLQKDLKAAMQESQHRRLQLEEAQRWKQSMSEENAALRKGVMQVQEAMLKLEEELRNSLHREQEARRTIEGMERQKDNVSQMQAEIRHLQEELRQARGQPQQA